MTLGRTNINMVFANLICSASWSALIREPLSHSSRCECYLPSLPWWAETLLKHGAKTQFLPLAVPVRLFLLQSLFTAWCLNSFVGMQDALKLQHFRGKITQSLISRGIHNLASNNHSQSFPYLGHDRISLLKETENTRSLWWERVIHNEDYKFMLSISSFFSSVPHSLTPLSLYPPPIAPYSYTVPNTH